jgi:hypothetical protein
MYQNRKFCKFSKKTNNKMLIILQSYFMITDTLIDWSMHCNYEDQVLRNNPFRFNYHEQIFHFKCH